MLIGEVARRSGVSARMLRHYESIGLLAPSERTAVGYREYSDADIGRIFHIEGLRQLGMSLAEVKDVLADPNFDTGGLLRDLIAQTRRRIASEQRLLDHLQRVERLGRTDSEALLWTVDLMRSLESADVIQRHKAALGGGVDGSVPVEALSAAVLDEPVLNAAGAMRWALAQAGPAAIGHLVTGIDDESAEVRHRAIRALDEIRRTTDPGELGPEAEDRIRGALLARLDDEDDEVRSLSAFALSGLGDPAAVPELLRIAMTGPRDIEAAEALSGFVIDGSDAEDEIMTQLRRAADSPRMIDRFRALQVLMEIPDEHGPAMERGSPAGDPAGDPAAEEHCRIEPEEHRGTVSDLLVRLARDESPEVAATAAAELRRRRDGPPRR